MLGFVCAKRSGGGMNFTYSWFIWCNVVVFYAISVTLKVHCFICKELGLQKESNKM